MALIRAVENDARVWNRTDTVCARLGSVRDIVLHERRHIRDLVQSAMHSHAYTSMLIALDLGALISLHLSWASFARQDLFTAFSGCAILIRFRLIVWSLISGII